MREIKFRAWDTKTKRMSTNQGFVLNVFGQIKAISGWEVMQFTGLLDKNGKEIYEGDIIEYRTEFKSQTAIRAKVYWQEFRACWAAGRTFTNSDLWERCRNGGTCKVIGNIYENAELLQEKELAA